MPTRTPATLTAAEQARILRRVAAAPVPRLVLAEVARGHHVALPDLQHWLKAHGYPEADRLHAAAAHLEQHPDTPGRPAPAESPDAAAGAGTPPRTPTGAVRPPTAAQQPEHRTGVGGDRLVRVALTDVHPDPDNLRTDDTADVDELAASIAAVGLLQNITCRVDHGRLVVIMGHRRLAALKHLGWTHTEVIVRQAAMRPDDVIAVMLLENGQRRDLDPIEEARGYAALARDIGKPRNATAVAKRLGRPAAVVARRMVLLDLEPDDQELVRAGRLSLGAAERKARAATGKTTGANPRKAPGHLAHRHPLADAVMTLCQGRGHTVKRGIHVGGVGCGQCWEDTIRADERRVAAAELAEASSRVGDPCPVCGVELDPDAAA